MVHRARGQKGKKKGGGDRFSGYGTFSSAALLFPRLSVGGAHHSVWPPLYSENTLYFRTPYISETATYYLAKRNLLIARAGNWRHTPPTEDGIPFLPRHRINGGGMEPTASRSCCRTSARTRMPTHDRCPCPLFGAGTPVSFFASY